MRLRYSFKALFVLFTIIGVGIGVFAARWHSARKQAENIAALQAANASVWYRYQAWKGTPIMNSPDPLAEGQEYVGANISPWTRWLGRRFGRDFVFDVNYFYAHAPLRADLVARVAQLRRLVHLRLNVGKEFDDEAWQALLRCRQIKRLSLEREQYNEYNSTRRLAGLATLAQLESLQVDGGELLVEDAREIAGLRNLRELTLQLVEVTDESLRPLAELKKLESFHLLHRGRGQRVTSKGIAFVAEMPKLRSLTLGRIESLDDEVLSHLENVAELELLNLDQATITGAEIHRLARLPKLTTLNLIGTKVDDEAMEKLSKLPQLESLDVSGTNVTDDGLRHVAALKNLRELRLFGNAISDAGMEHISSLAQLEELMIGNTNVTDAGLEHLEKLSKLRALWLGDNSKVTKSGVLQLEKALPKCNVYPPLPF
jgi:Leucine-rich repeat (LRR) protein